VAAVLDVALSAPTVPDWLLHAAAAKQSSTAMEHRIVTRLNDFTKGPSGVGVADPDSAQWSVWVGSPSEGE